MRDFGVDGNLIEQFRAGNRSAIKAVSSVLARHLEHDPSDAITALAEVLERIGKGEDPNSAFGWTKHGKNGRRSDVNNALRDFEVRTEVQSLMREGSSLTAACAAVSTERNGIFLLSNKTVEAICKGLSKDTELSEIPNDAFPLTPNKYTKST